MEKIKSFPVWAVITVSVSIVVFFTFLFYGIIFILIGKSTNYDSYNNTESSSAIEESVKLTNLSIGEVAKFDNVQVRIDSIEMADNYYYITATYLNKYENYFYVDPSDMYLIDENGKKTTHSYYETDINNYSLRKGETTTEIIAFEAEDPSKVVVDLFDDEYKIASWIIPENIKPTEPATQPVTKPKTEPPKEKETKTPTKPPTEPPTNAPETYPPETDPPPPPPVPQTVEKNYVLNTNTMKIHTTTCGSVSDIYDENRADVYGTLDEFISQGYEPCKRCNPN